MNRRILHIILFVVAALVLADAAAYAQSDKFVLVVDAGHGGKDYGALGVKANEKTINLNVALRLGKLVEKNFDNVKVVYTRSTDKFVSLQERANIANRAHGNLFISIHTNSIDKKNKARTRISGSSTYTLGLHRTDDNFEVAKRENSVISLEDGYKMTYQDFDPNSTESYIIFELNQNRHVDRSIDLATKIQHRFADAGRKDNGVRQAGFLVLAKTSMPAVLVELDYICNPDQEDYLTSDDGQQQLAQAIYDAFADYYAANARYADTLARTSKKSDKVSAAAKKPAEQKKAPTISPDDVIYRVQFLTSEKRLSMRSACFKGMDADKIKSYKEDGLYKYTYGETLDKNEVRRTLDEVRQRHPEAFIIKLKNGKRIK
ncbi:MAG: N-acetylmuramoyl-L-alanine amidase [Bacteroidales bacterium]|nr:N-acetylmuramoyl-L-alanine amidase [Bacteroidales bacterium]MDD6623033.1 N-acetylmuramoyl-L-alanine amidase [Bacteroidales bacterium]